MKAKKLRLLSLLALGCISLTGCYVDLGFISFGEKPVEKTDEEKKNGEIKAYDAEKDAAAIVEYYTGVDLSGSGDTLLSVLRSHNLAKRTSTVGYASMGSDASGKYKYTDFDPATVKYNTEGIPYGTRISSFYSGKSVIKFDREHVWPASRLPGGRDGNIVDSDIFMPRPTCSEENQDRSNYVYGTGGTTASGWDPVTAFANSCGTFEGIRGECARIVFYCMLVDDRLELSDSTSNNKNNMGKLTDLLRWNLDNPVTDREKRRNVGGQYLQGNRNTFVDHPEYACKIWGNTNSTTKSICGK